jgi:exodeoxyribonuclease-3
VKTSFSTFSDPQKRILDASLGSIRLLNLYIPNGSTLDSDKYAYKLDWLSHAYTHIKEIAMSGQRFIVMGDFNIAPTELDVHDPSHWSDCVLVSPPERAWFQSILDLGMIDTFRALHPKQQGFSWWDYRGGSFRRNHGLRIDFILASLNLPCYESLVDQHCRAQEQPSDHAPVLTRFSI